MAVNFKACIHEQQIYYQMLNGGGVKNSKDFKELYLREKSVMCYGCSTYYCLDCENKFIGYCDVNEKQDYITIFMCRKCIHYTRKDDQIKNLVF